MCGRVQRESVQKAQEIRQLTSRLSELNGRLADELAEQRRLVADYDRIRETAQRALGVLHVIRDAESVLEDTKNRLLETLAERDGQQPAKRQQQQQQLAASFSADTDDDNDHVVDDDPLGLD